MMFKLVVARAINSAFLLFIITSDTEQFQADTLTKVARLCFVTAVDFFRTTSSRSSEVVPNTAELRFTFNDANRHKVVCRTKKKG